MTGHEIGELLSVLLFLSSVVLVMIGFPVAFTLGGSAVLFAFVGEAFGAFSFDLSSLAERYFGTMTNEVLVAVPLFVFMGVVLERSGIAESLLLTMGRLFGRMRGGLGVSVVLVGALLAASTGIIGATVVTMGLLSLPAMMRAGYDPKLATGVICASGTLGQIIPPSTVLIFVGDILQGANASAQMAKGNYAPDPVSVGQLFAGAVGPGLLLVLLYLGFVLFRAWTQPASAPALREETRAGASLARDVVFALLPPLLLILAVLGSIMASIATPTESASVGAMGAMLLAVLRRRLGLAELRSVMRSTLTISSMVFVVLMGASAFSLVFRGLGGDLLVESVLRDLPGGAFGAVFAVMAVMFVLGFFIDTFEIVFIVLPIAGPVLLGFDISPIWLGVMIGVNLQTSFLTPPFGFALFYLRGIAPAAIRTADIYRGVLPFVGIQLLALTIVAAAPVLATWLPDQIFRTGRATTPGAAGEQSPGDALKTFMNDFEGDPADAGQ
ncbi:TRAP transporter large permease [Zavarzinia aquatilis]|uniref:TRAP transporter large permease protein n=1 Tax=Zavarzinia aquatilis TaxID=2211142 RepID=A0A317ECS9_9PROT|nr:TRAP transporter large permease subunit [Zavarzinia aquatilis]PWR24837.1 C4-dicarboxylate ABC transporter [Zavarzinia aquatilis]